MKKIILSILFILSIGCTVWDANNRNCHYYEEDGLYYDWRELPQKVPCTSLNKKIERERKKGN